MLTPEINARILNDFRLFREQHIMDLGQNAATAPVSLDGWKATLRVDDISPTAFGIDGCLIPSDAPGRYRILYRIDRSEYRTRFTIAHELAHIWLNDWSRSDRGIRFRVHDWQAVEERLADSIAAEMLMPRPIFASAAKTARRQLLSASHPTPPPWVLVAQLSREFFVSYSAVVRQLEELPENPIVRCVIRTNSMRSTTDIKLDGATSRGTPKRYALSFVEAKRVLKSLSQLDDQRHRWIDVHFRTPNGQQVIPCVARKAPWQQSKTMTVAELLGWAATASSNSWPHTVSSNFGAKDTVQLESLMPLDFSRLKTSHPSDIVLEPREIFRALPGRSRKYQFPRDVQTEVWTRWFSRRNERDTLLKLNTGSGKTVVGLVLLKSCLNEGVSPAVYVAPSPYLAGQVVREAQSLGIAVEQDPRAVAVAAGRAILVTTIKTLFNGRSQFGVGDEGVKIGIGSIVIDDAHACLQETEEQFTLTVPRGTDAFNELFAMFRESLLAQSHTKVYDLEEAEPNTILSVPFWVWHNNLRKIVKVLHSLRSDEKIQFVWPLIKDVLSECRCVLGPAGAEISPVMTPADLIPSFAQARRRIFMGATFTDDSVLVSHFDVNPAALSAVVTPDSANDIGDRMILVPQALNPKLTDNDLKGYLAYKAQNVNVVVIVPSAFRANYWRDAAAQVLTAENLADGVESLRARHVGLTVIINRYDGIDLPDDACRILVIDGLPDVRRLIDKNEQRIRHAWDALSAEAIQRIDQGMGRGNRSADDWCVVFLMGRSLTGHLYSPGAKLRFTTATRAQWELSETLLAEQLRGKDINHIEEAVNYCLSRNPEWVGASRGALVGLKYPTSPQVDPIILARRKAFNAGRTNDLLRAIEHLRPACNSLNDRAAKGWLTAELASYQHRLDPAQAQITLRSAKEMNMQVITPLAGVTYHRLAADLSNQAGRCLNYLRAKFTSGTALVVYVNALVDDLRFVPETAPVFERSIAALGELIGFEVQRPEADYGRGPDVLWRMGNLLFAVIEAKNGAITDRISKSDCNQLAGSVNWFGDEYDGSCNMVALMIHPSSRSERDATPPKDAQVITTERLGGLVEAIRQFVAALATKHQFGEVAEVAHILANCGLSAATFVSCHSTLIR